MPTYLKVNTGGGGDKPVQKTLNSGNDPNLNLFEAREIIANAIGKGAVGLNDGEARANFSRLSSLLGAERAQKLFTKLALYNQDSSARALPIGDRVARFYDSNDDDPEMMKFLSQVKGLSYGPKAGVYDPTVNYGGTKPDIMLKIAKK